MTGRGICHNKLMGVYILIYIFVAFIDRSIESHICTNYSAHPGYIRKHLRIDSVNVGTRERQASETADESTNIELLPQFSIIGPIIPADIFLCHR